jgi:hypothetical protein
VSAGEAPARVSPFAALTTVQFTPYGAGGLVLAPERIAPALFVDGVQVGVVPELSTVALVGAGVLLPGAWTRRDRSA